MSKNWPLMLVVAGVFILLTVMFFYFWYLEHKQEETLAYWTGEDDLTQSIRNEADQYRNMNRNQKLGIAAVGAVIVLIAAGWRVCQGRGRQKSQAAPGRIDDEKRI
ncbi:MAG: hypothetical protein IT364_13110 [Candidatus Hydrogenedentes bacterium]|nr:hypothetical protein [Candidatus Hydrogenedentota bacterium]